MKQQAKEQIEKKGYFMQIKSISGEPLTKPLKWRVNGKMKEWVRKTNCFKIPVKHGLYTYDYITESNINLFEGFAK